METANYECVRCLFCRTGKEESVVALVKKRAGAAPCSPSG